MKVLYGWENVSVEIREVDHEKNEQIKRWVQADPTQRKTTRLKKQVTFNAPVNLKQDRFSWGC